MTFWRRLRTYLIGVGLGLLIVYVIFGDRELNSWTPQKRVLRAIDSSEVSISERVICQLACLNMQEADWKKVQQSTKVDFSESNTKKKPCPVYHLKGADEESDFLLIWEVCENLEKVKLLSISKKGRKCGCS